MQSVIKPMSERVSSPYMLLSADDVLTPVSAIEKCVLFLEDNPDYAVAQGYQSSMYYSGEGYYFKMGSNISPAISSDSPSDRLLKLLACPPMFWGVWRSDACKEAFANIPLDILNDPRCVVCEVMVYISTALVGKHKRLPIFFGLHEDVPSVDVERRRGFTHWEFITRPEHREQFEYFIKQGSDMLMRYEPLTREESENYVLKALQLFALPQMNSVGKKTLMYRVKRELCSFWNKTGGRRAFRERKKKQLALFQAVNHARLEAMETECRAEMDRVAEFVFKYPRCHENRE